MKEILRKMWFLNLEIQIRKFVCRLYLISRLPVQLLTDSCWFSQCYMAGPSLV